MFRYFQISIFIIFCASAFCQENSEKFIKAILDDSYSNEIQISQENPLAEFNNLDFSSLWLEDHKVYGFIGANYQRFDIKFISIIKVPSENKTYKVFGKSKVKENICDFQGEIKIEAIHNIKNSESLEEKCALLIFNYRFYEDPKQKHTGIFKGKGMTSLCQSADGKIYYNEEMITAEGFRNNQFVGIWRNYNSSDFKTCNWGDYRIPMAGDLDFGGGEFKPNDKYADFGWKNLLKTFNTDNVDENNNAQRKENIQWWK